ncbi:MAG: translation initiation factor IF-2 [Peptococcaceae bacterium]|nr:translation initiation factor IF-2 [Peptococcaceae bacterium]
MVKKRVHELAKELNVESKDIIKGMARLGINLKSHMSTLEEKDIDLYLATFHGKKDKGAAEPAGKPAAPPAAKPAAQSVPGPAAPPEKQPPGPQGKPAQDKQARSAAPAPEDRKRPDRRDYRFDRGPGLVDRVPSRPPDRRFEDRSLRTTPLKKAIPQQPPASPHRQEAGRPQPSPVLPAAQQPAPVQVRHPEERLADRDKAVVRPETTSQPPAGKDRPKYPDRMRPSMLGGQDPARDHRPAPGRDRPGDARPAPDRDRKADRRPEGDRGAQQRGPASGGGFNRPRTEADRQRHQGDDRGRGDRPGGAPAAGRPGQGRGRGGPRPAQPAGDRPKPAALKVPKVPDQAKGIDKIKASEKSRARIAQTQTKVFGKDRRYEEDFEERSLRLVPGRKKGVQQKARTDQRPAVVQEKKPVVIGETVTVQELAEKMKKSPAELIKKLMQLGILATINQEIDSDTAVILAGEFGFEAEVKIELDAEAQLEMEQQDDPADLVPRPCVVTVMGHVDHGKTSLLDAIRETNVIATEAGGITQHIGAYQVEYNNKKITFVDTPGHEAFTAMRARGAQVTDIAVLVVAAEDGVMPQTVEAINHAKAAGVPIVVAINKMDRPEANPERVKQQLTEHNLVPEEWGGDVICVPVSAKQKQGIDDLLESILLVAEVNDLKANPNRPARGTVIEAELDKGRGPVASVLVQNGTLHVGDAVVAGTSHGRVRAMMDDKGRRIKKAGPSTPVEVLGFNEVPQAGDTFYVVKDEKMIKQIIDKRLARKRQEELKSAAPRVTLEDLFRNIREGQVKELRLVIKADVQGSVEAIRQSLERLSTDEVKVHIIHGGVGAISEADIMLASTSNAIVIGFNVRPDVNARRAAETEKVDIRLYRVIYDAIEDIKAAMSGLLEPELREVTLGRAEVRKIFKASKLGTIAGCYVSEGKITRDAGVRLIRDGVVVYEGRIDSLKRFKDDVREVLQGYECGMTLENYQDIHEGDIIEAFTTEKIKRELA